MNLLSGIPERVRDHVAPFDANRLGYRHGPAFPTLQEVVMHLSSGGIAADDVIRHVCVEGAPEADPGAALAPAGELDGANDAAEKLDELVRNRRRTMDLLRGLPGEAWDRPIGGPRYGELTLLDFCRLVATHEMAHLSQVRNLSSLLPE